MMYFMKLQKLRSYQWSVITNQKNECVRLVRLAKVVFGQTPRAQLTT